MRRIAWMFVEKYLGAREAAMIKLHRLIINKCSNLSPRRERGKSFGPNWIIYSRILLTVLGL